MGLSHESWDATLSLLRSGIGHSYDGSWDRLVSW